MPASKKGQERGKQGARGKSAEAHAKAPGQTKDKEIKSVEGAGAEVEGAKERVEDANAKMVWGDAEPDAPAEGEEEEQFTAEPAPVPANDALQPPPTEPPEYDPAENADLRTAENWDFEKNEAK